MDIAILGGGISGLTSAYRLAATGARVTLYEASDRLGGLATWFEYEGHKLDRFYHVILDSDTHLMKLLGDLKLAERVRWSKTRMGFFVRGKCYPFNSAADLLRFGALRFIDRVRTGMAAVYITKFCKNGLPLDDELAHVWLRKLFGPRVYRAIWEPLLTAKFGDLRDRVPAYWVWNTLNREKNGSEEVKGYVNGGYSLVSDELAAAIQRLGGEVHLRTPVQQIETTGDGVQLKIGDQTRTFDAAIATVPLPLLHRLAGPKLAPRVPLPKLAFQGVVNVLLVCKKPLDQYYWTAVVDSNFPFQGIVETTHVIDPQWIGGRHILYVMNYCSADTPTYSIDDERVKREAVDGLGRLYPHFDKQAVESVHVFRTPHVEPVWTTGYLRERPAPQIAGTTVFLATTAQAYPMVTSWNTSVKLSEEAVAALLAQLRPQVESAPRGSGQVIAAGAVG